MNIQERVSLKDKNTLGIDATARCFAVVKNREDLEKVVEYAEQKEIEILVLGGGSNICFAEKDIDKLVLFVQIQGIEEQEDIVIVGAGENWDEFVQKGIKFNVPNIENLSGIPGTVGASPIQNIGAYGVEVKDLIMWVEVFDFHKKEIRRLSNVSCKFAYRDSIFKKEEGNHFIVIRVAFRKESGSGVNIEYKDLQNYFGESKPNPAQVRRAVLDIRKGKFPDLGQFGTAGSFFKNPIISKEKYEELNTIIDSSIPSYPVDDDRVKIPLAWILDTICNLKGYREGNVWLHDAQPLILVTNKKATADEIKKFSTNIQQKVYDMTGIHIEREVALKS